MRRFPPPWTVEALDGCSLSGFKVIDANGQSLAYVYSRETKDAANIAGVLTEDEASQFLFDFLAWLRSCVPIEGRQQRDGGQQCDAYCFMGPSSR
jgi:hypothetical protein